MLKSAGREDMDSSNDELSISKTWGSSTISVSDETKLQYKKMVE